MSLEMAESCEVADFNGWQKVGLLKGLFHGLAGIDDSMIQFGLPTLPLYGRKLGLYGNDSIDVKTS